MLGLGLGLQFNSRPFGSRFDPQAVAHYDRVIADGGVIPAGLVGCDAWFKAVKAAYGVTDITTAISSGLDPHYLGYKLGAGSGATLGSAAQTCYNAIGAIGDVIQTTAASQPLILPHTGTNYVWLPGIVGNNFTTPNAAANQIVGDFDIKVEISTGILSGSESGLFAKYNGITNNAQYVLVLRGDGFLRCYISTNGTTNTNAVSSVAVSNNWSGWVRCTRVSSTGLVTFFTSLDGITWTQLGTTFTLGTGNLFNGNSVCEVGSYNAGASGSSVMVTIRRSMISNTIGGNAVVDFNPANYSARTSQTQWTSSTGEVWTINMGTTTTGYKVAIVDRSILMSDGVDDKLISSSLSFTAPTYMQVVTRVFPTSPGTTAICGGNNLNYYTQDGGLRRSVKDGNIQGDASGYTARILCLEGLQISRTANQFIFSRNDSTTLTTSIGGAPITDSSVISMFANLAGNLPSNCSVNSLVFSTYPSTTQRTSFYNVLRAFNNNAF